MIISRCRRKIEVYLKEEEKSGGVWKKRDVRLLNDGEMKAF